MNERPASVKLTVRIEPSGPLGVSAGDGSKLSIRLSGKIEVEKRAASTASPSNHRQVVILSTSGPPSSWNDQAYRRPPDTEATGPARGISGTLHPPRLRWRRPCAANTLTDLAGRGYGRRA